MRKVLNLVTVFSLLLMSTIALGQTQGSNKDAQFSLNQASPGAMQKYQLGSLVTYKKVWALKGTWNKATQAGTGTVNLADEFNNSLKLPKGAIVTDCIIDVLTTPTTSGVTGIAFGTGQATNDLKANLAVASYTGLVTCVPIGSAATAIKLTADRTPTVTFTGTTPATAGKINVIIQYVLSDL